MKFILKQDLKKENGDLVEKITKEYDCNLTATIGCGVVTGNEYMDSKKIKKVILDYKNNNVTAIMEDYVLFD